MGRPSQRTLATLSQLRQVREEKVSHASRALGQAVAAREAAGQARGAAEAEHDAHTRRAAAALEGERAALERGELRAGDLAQEAAWRGRLAGEGAALAAHLEQARNCEQVARGGERDARGELAARKGDADAVAAVVSQREAEQRKSAEAHAEEAASDVWRARKPPAPPA